MADHRFCYLNWRRLLTLKISKLRKKVDMSSSTFEVKESESESEKVLDFGIDTCEENGLEVSANVDGEVPRDHTYTKEPDVDKEGDIKEGDSGDKQTETMEENSTPKKRGRTPKPKKTDKLIPPKGKAKKEIVKKEPVNKKGKKKDIVDEEANPASEEPVNNGEADVKVEAPAVEEETPKSNKRGKKRKVEEKENVIDQSIVEEVQNITEDPASSNETTTETPSKKKKASKEEKPPKEEKTPKKTPKSKAVSSADESEDKVNLPKGWTRKTVVRKSGKTAGMVDVYIYSPDGIKFRSKPDVASYLAKIKSPLKIEDFDFSKRKSSIKTTNTNSPKTPTKTKSTPVKAKQSEKKKTASPKKSPKLVVKISVSKKKNDKKTKTAAKEVKKSKTPVKAAKTKSAKAKGNKKKA